MDDPRGATWRKWDLHVHTPDSLVNQYTARNGNDAWTEFISDLERLPKEIEVVGINDYLFLDGYRRVRQEKAVGRLANLKLILPVVELRLDKFGGTLGHLSRINFHVIFSDEIDPDTIEQQFLLALSNRYALSPQHSSAAEWRGVLSKPAIEELGKAIIASVPVEKQGEFGSPLQEGFNNLCLSHADVLDALDKPFFKDKHITALGKTEWADVKWNDQSIAEKKNIINRADFVFISAASPAAYERARKALAKEGVNDKLLDCSDAHRFSDSPEKDRLGKCFTWVKSNPSFDGLRHTVIEFDDRVFAGDVPPLLSRVATRKTKYISSVGIHKNAGSFCQEKWFDNAFAFNPGLVAIIGNKGSGKSALADILGLIGNSRQESYFSFLRDNKFRNSRGMNKAKEFSARLIWEDGTQKIRNLGEAVDRQKPESIFYLPQGYFEQVCNELGVGGPTGFDVELRKVIFSHVPLADQLGHADLDSLMNKEAEQAKLRLQKLVELLSTLNEEIVALEYRVSPTHRSEIQNLLKQKEAELKALDDSHPPMPVQPAQASSDADNAIASQIGEVQTTIADFGKQQQAYEAIQQRLAKQLAAADRVASQLKTLQGAVDDFIMATTEDTALLGLTIDTIIEFKLHSDVVSKTRQRIADERPQIDRQLDPKTEDSVIAQRLKAAEALKELQDRLGEPQRLYQAAMTAVAQWETARTTVIGDSNTKDTVEFYRTALTVIDLLPQQLDGLYGRRKTIAGGIHDEITSLSDRYRQLYQPVQQFIQQHPLAKERIGLTFDVTIQETGLTDRFFELVSHAKSGTFCGKAEGAVQFGKLLKTADFNNRESVLQFLDSILAALTKDQRHNPPVSAVLETQLRNDRSRKEVYDLLYSMKYLEPRYTLKLGTKNVHQLSPGEKGALLLIFYLLVDRNDAPLVIDQPEENLDNQTIYSLLVPSVKDAKKRRQVFIVTHNPNLAVVCDADQVICASLDPMDGSRVDYLTGALEARNVNKYVVDILEGTREAFDNRDSKYLEQTVI